LKIKQLKSLQTYSRTFVGFFYCFSSDISFVITKKKINFASGYKLSL